MIRGTFANIRLRNQLVPGVEGGVTRHLPDGEQLSIFDAAAALRTRRRAADHPRRRRIRLRVLAGLGGQGHPAARGQGGAGDLLRTDPPLQPDRHGGAAAAVHARAVTAKPGPDRRGDLLDHRAGRCGPAAPEVTVRVEADGRPPGSTGEQFTATVRIDTPAEAAYFRHGGILPYVLRQLLR